MLCVVVPNDTHHDNTGRNNIHHNENNHDKAQHDGIHHNDDNQNDIIIQ